MDAEDVLKEVASLVAECKGCQLSFSRKLAVPGEGPANAKIMLIGEGPGFYENEQGKPFVGASGSYLDELLQKAGVSRKAVFITNVVKCRPPGNRDPLPDELQACSAYLDRQIAAINPLIIVTLGRFSMSKFLNNAKISEVHGKPVWVRGRMIVPMFHPAAALHQPSLKVSVEQDFSHLPEYIKQAELEAARHLPADKSAGADITAGQDKTAAEERTAVAERTAAAQMLLEGAGPDADRSAAPASLPAVPDAKPQFQQDPGQQSLFGDLLDAPPPSKDKSEEETSHRKDQPTQLSLF